MIIIENQCDVIERLKLVLPVDGDVALFIYNSIAHTVRDATDEDLFGFGLHDHTRPKIHALMDSLGEFISANMEQQP